MSGYLRIGGALLVGATLVVSAFVVAERNTKTNVASAIVSVAPDRVYIEPSDADGNGEEDWKKAFPEKKAQIELPESASSPEAATDVYENPTTFTGKFAKAFFTDYMRTKSTDESSVYSEDFIQSAIDSIEGSARGRVYTRLDVRDVPDSPEALHEYGNAMALVFAPETEATENQLYILERAVKTQNPAELAALLPIIEMYAGILSRSKEVPVPKSLVDDHAALLTTIDAIRTDVEAMNVVFTDPLYALARVKQHQDNVAGFFSVIKSITTTLLASGVSYEKDEPGAIIYTIDI